MQQIKFTTIFPNCENVHLVKDVGMIPYCLYKELGYDSTMACFNENFEYAQSVVKGLKFQKIALKGILSHAKYIWKNAKNIDVLNMYFAVSKENMILSFLYKLRNPKGITYIKMDENLDILKRFDFWQKNFKGMVYRKYLRSCDLISSETIETCQKLSENWRIKISYIPNGFYTEDESKRINYEDKENYLCTVGRLGTAPKKTDELLEGFALFAKNNANWKLLLIGPVEDDFMCYEEEYFKRYPELKERVIFTGNISDRDELYNLYAKSKVFVLSSAWENFALVYLEALANGCRIVTTKVGAYKDVTNNGKFGEWYNSGHPEELALKLDEVCNDEKKLKDNCIAAQNFVYEKFSWHKIVRNLDAEIKEILANK